MGKTLRLNNQADHAVTGVIADVPKNSHFTFNMLLSFETLYAENRRAQERWLGFPNYTYLLLGEGVRREDLEAKLPAFVEAHMAGDLKAVHGTLRYLLQPLTRIHLHSRLDRDIAAQGGILYVNIFAAVALFILLLACINFVNLSTARASTQAREIGVRKACGATRQDLVRHFLAEAFAHGMVALVIALGLSELALSYFSSMAGNDLRIRAGRLQWLIPSFIGLFVFVGVAAGSSPAFQLSAYRPAAVLKGKENHWLPVVSKGTTGLEEVTAVGCGVMLVKREVFENTPKPWFWFEQIPGGKLLGEDVYFCIKALDAGYPTYLDHNLSNQIGHVGQYTFGWHDYPETKDGTSDLQRPQD